ncbi:MAG: ATP-binding protein [Halieaceae bacterium]|nr:ATP-binding protein [Halieaceae bacterium]
MREKLRQLLAILRFNGMAEVLDRILDQAEKEATPVAQVLIDLLNEEHRHRQERSLAYRIRQAKLPWDWSIDTFPFDQQPAVSPSQIKSLAGLDFIGRAQNIVFVGPPGTGKTGLALGLLRQALINGHRGRFYKAQDLIDELYASLADRTTTKVLNRLSQYAVLLIDELGYLTLKSEQVNAFFKLLDMRYGKVPTIITTNLAYSDWYELFQRKSLVDALLDRLQHHCITLQINGPSLRTPDPTSSPPQQHKKSANKDLPANRS